MIPPGKKNDDPVTKDVNAIIKQVLPVNKKADSLIQEGGPVTKAVNVVGKKLLL